jgi:hypothetical protein
MRSNGDWKKSSFRKFVSFRIPEDEEGSKLSKSEGCIKSSEFFKIDFEYHSTIIAATSFTKAVSISSLSQPAWR